MSEKPSCGISYPLGAQNFGEGSTSMIPSSRSAKSHFMPSRGECLPGGLLRSTYHPQVSVRQLSFLLYGLGPAHCLVTPGVGSQNFLWILFFFILGYGHLRRAQTLAGRSLC